MVWFKLEVHLLCSKNDIGSTMYIVYYDFMTMHHVKHKNVLFHVWFYDNASCKAQKYLISCMNTNVNKKHCYFHQNKHLGHYKIRVVLSPTPWEKFNQNLLEKEDQRLDCYIFDHTNSMCLSKASLGFLNAALIVYVNTCPMILISGLKKLKKTQVDK